MGKRFTPPKTIYRLDFEGTELEGLEVRMRGGKLRTVFEVAPLVGVTEETATASDVQASLEQYVMLADHLVEWNVDDDMGNPVPPTLEGLQSQEVRHVNMIAAAWQRAQVDVPTPLAHGSNSGPLPDVLTIPMESIPASLVS